MLSKVERQHLVLLEQWSRELRVATTELQTGPLAKLIQKVVAPGQSVYAVSDNVDWLIALIRREDHTHGVQALLDVVEKKETK